MIDTTTLLGASPWVVITAIMTWGGQAWLYRNKTAKETEASVSKIQNELTIQLLSSARAEAEAMESKFNDLHEQVSSLRQLEQHFYHFKQALDHIDAMVHALGEEERASAIRSGKAFLKRMKRLLELREAAENARQEKTA